MVDRDYDVAAILGHLYGEGIIGLRGAFAPEFVDSLRSQVLAHFEESRAVPDGAVPRGPNRWYVELQPERLAGFVEVVGHPWFVAVSTAVLGADYKIVELGFDLHTAGMAASQTARQILDAENVPFRLDTELGEAADVIAQTAEVEGVNEIVMGSRGMNQWQGMVVGSVAYRVIHRVSVPITIVGTPSQGEPLPAATPDGLHRVLLAVPVLLGARSMAATAEPTRVAP